MGSPIFVRCLEVFFRCLFVTQVVSIESRDRLSAVTGELSVSATRRLGKDPGGRSRFALPILPLLSYDPPRNSSLFGTLIRMTS